MKDASAAGSPTSKRTALRSGISLALSLVAASHMALAGNTPAGKTELAPGAKGRAKPAQKATVPSPPECQRIGQRVIAALARDDSGSALQFHTFYTAFNCSAQELTQAFGCLVNLQTAVPSLSSPTPQQVAQCWADPTTLPEVAPPPAKQKQGGEGGEKN
jgi:hypothetical protein